MDLTDFTRVLPKYRIKIPSNKSVKPSAESLFLKNIPEKKQLFFHVANLYSYWILKRLQQVL